LPNQERVLRWRDMTSDDFRFCFKFPATISHQAALSHCDDLRDVFFSCLSPLANRIGQYWLQLPATFSPADLPKLWHFLDNLPDTFTYGVEVRHPAFFDKGEDCMYPFKKNHSLLEIFRHTTHCSNSAGG